MNYKATVHYITTVRMSKRIYKVYLNTLFCCTYFSPTRRCSLYHKIRTWAHV